jgi:hypothetical protein
MWKLALVAAVLGVGGAGILGQSGVTSSFDYGSLLGGAVGSSPLAATLIWRLLKADKDNQTLRDEVVDLHRQTVVVAERMAPILSDATRALNDFRDGVEATIERGRTRPAETPDEVITRLETVLGELLRKRDR